MSTAEYAVVVDYTHPAPERNTEGPTLSRVLGRVRLSRVTDATTSPERQREVIEQWATAHGHEVIGWAVDLDVSRSVDPFEAPELGSWFTDHADAWDIIACWKLDRLATGSIYLNRVLSWCQDHGKTLTSVTEDFNLSTWVGRVLAGVIAGLAEGELEAIQERNANAYQHNRKLGKWTGGVPFMGYLPQPDESGGWRYVPDSVLAPEIQQIARKIIDGESIRSIVNDLNDRQIPTAKDRALQWQDKETKGYRYSISALQRTMRSEMLLGYSVVRDPKTDANNKPEYKNGKKQYGAPYILREEDGTPVQRGPALLDRETFDQLQAQLDARQYTGSYTVRSTALLLRIIHCGVCDRPMYTVKGRSHLYYRCAAKNYRKTCPNKMIRQDHIDHDVTELLIGDYGHLERKKRVYEPGEDHSTELAEVNGLLSDLAGLIGTGPYQSGPVRAKLEERINTLDLRRQELESLPSRQAGYRYEPTGETFAEYWDRLSQEEKNLFLRDIGVRYTWKNVDDITEAHLDAGDLRSWLAAIDPDRDPETHLQQREAEQAQKPWD